MSDTSRKREDKQRGKVYFIRIREESYKKIAELADKNERSTNSMANVLLRQKLEELEQDTKKLP